MMRGAFSNKNSGGFAKGLMQFLTIVMVLGLLVTPSVALAATPNATEATTSTEAAISGPVVVRSGGAQLYSAPNGDVVESLAIGTVVTASGRTEDSQWVVGTAPDGKIGWLQVGQLIAVGIDLLPVYDVNSDVDSSAQAPDNTGIAPDTANDGNATGDANSTANSVSAAPTVAQSDAAAAQSAPALQDATSNSQAAQVAAQSESPTDPALAGVSVIGTVASGTDRLNVRSGPGTDYAIIDRALSGAQYAVSGRSEDGTWLQINLAAGGTGWVSASYMTIQGDPSTLPVVAVAAASEAGAAATLVPASLTETASSASAPSSAAVSDLSGTLVIETSPGGMIYGFSLDSGSLWPLSNGFDPAISPDGKTVAFVRDGGESGIYLIDIDGSNERLIFSGRARLSSPKWSPDGQWILFTRSDDAYHCIALGPSCTTPRSANGREVTIPGVDPTTRYWYNLARVDRDGNNYRDIPSLTSARAGDWNEAGIVYESAAGLQITADTPEDQNHLVIFDYLKPYFNDPDWQPNGGRIVYMGKEASHWELFAVNPDGSGKVALTKPETTVVDVIPSNVAPAWSPDGTHIVFLSNREDNHEAGKWRVWVMDADGSNQHPLPIDLEINYTFGDEQSVAWAS